MLPAFRVRLTQGLAASLPQHIDVAAHERLRLRLLFGVALLKLFNFIGGAWDIQWHVAIGRDNLWIPPHLLVVFAFVSGLGLVLALIAYESGLAATGLELPHSLRIGPLRGPAAAFGVSAGYLVALASGGLDELWHEIFGIDATLWSPPHLLIMFATMIVDYSLMLGLAASTHRQGYEFKWNSPLLWSLVLTGAYAFESVNFQMGEAFIVAHRAGGAGLYGLLFPLLLGAFLPLPMMALIRLSQRTWIVLLVFALTLALQYVATGIAAVGFAILKPVSVIDEYVRLNPDSTAAMAREFAGLLGFNGLIGFHQAWTMSLSGPALALVALFGRFNWLKKFPLLAAPVFSTAMVLSSFVWFEQVPALQNYPLSAWHVLLATVISAAGGLLTGSLGLRLAGD